MDSKHSLIKELHCTWVVHIKGLRLEFQHYEVFQPLKMCKMCECALVLNVSTTAKVIWR